MLVVGLLILGSIATGGIALAGGFAAQPEPSPAPKATTLPPELSAHFAALSAGVGAGVASVGSASAETKTVLDSGTQGIGAQFGLNASLAKEVTYGKSHVWLVPGSAGVCIQDYEGGEAAGGVCGPIADAIAGTITLDVGGNENGHTGGGTIYGLAPNGNSQIVVHDADGSSEKVPVEHNVYIITHPGAISVEVADGSGNIHSVPVPG